MRGSKSLFSQILGVVCFRTAISTKLVVHRPCGKPVSGGVELQKMSFSSQWLIDFAPDRKSHVHRVCGLASVHAKMPVLPDRARMSRAPKGMQKSISTCIPSSGGLSCGAWGAYVGTHFPPTGWIPHSPGVSACTYPGARPLLVHASSGIPCFGLLRPSISDPGLPVRRPTCMCIALLGVEALVELGRRPPQRRLLPAWAPAEQGQDAHAV